MTFWNYSIRVANGKRNTVAACLVCALMRVAWFAGIALRNYERSKAPTQKQKFRKFLEMRCDVQRKGSLTCGNLQRDSDPLCSVHARSAVIYVVGAGKRSRVLGHQA